MLAWNNFTLGTFVMTVPCHLLVLYASGHAFQEESLHKFPWDESEDDQPAFHQAFLLALLKMAIFAFSQSSGTFSSGAFPYYYRSSKMIESGTAMTSALLGINHLLSSFLFPLSLPFLITFLLPFPLLPPLPSLQTLLKQSVNQFYT